MEGKMTFTIDLDNRKKLKRLNVHQVFLVSFYGGGIVFRWLFGNFIQLLKVVLNFDKFKYIPMSHIEAVGVAIEFTNTHEDAVFYMINYEDGRMYKRIFYNQVKINKDHPVVSGTLEVNSYDGYYCASYCGVGCSRDFEHDYRWTKLITNPNFKLVLTDT